MPLTNNPPRILIVDDNRSIHDDFRKVLCSAGAASMALQAAEAALFGGGEATDGGPGFEIVSAYQGEEAIALVQQSRNTGQRFAMAFMDVRMPPGLDGIETTARLWQIDRDLQVVLCTAYSDYSWADVREKVGQTDGLVILKKPFDNIEVLQLAHALTEKWRLLHQARVKMTDLEAMVQRRTSELQTANEQLQAEIVERKHAEEALRQNQELMMRQERLAAVGQLSAGVAHDFNNIMTVIQGHASLLTINPVVPSSVHPSLREIEAAAQRAAKLTRQLLAFSRKQVMQSRPVDLAEVVSQMTTMLSRALGELVSLRFDRPDNLPSIVADPGMVEQVLMNLALNARDAMPAGGQLNVTLKAVDLDAASIEGRSEARVGRFVCLCVRDTGCGMDPDTLSHLFEPFFTTKDVGKGTGLGLATAYGIVKQHHGWIEVESEVGHGSTFTVFLPASEIAVAEAARALQKTAKPTAGKGETILIVEDEPALRRLVRNIFERNGYTVLEAACGQDALEVWRQANRPVDLLLTDMIMPHGISGRDVAATLLAENPCLRVIFTSGYSQDIAADVNLSEGVNFLGKPYVPNVLLDIVRRSLDMRPEASVAA